MDLSILKCPVTGTSLVEADSDMLRHINASNTDALGIERGLVNESGSLFYPILKNVIVLLPHYAIKLNDTVETKAM